MKEVVKSPGHSLRDHYDHARRHCGCGPLEAVYRAIYAQITGRWPW